jgi:hypothetical protein
LHCQLCPLLPEPRYCPACPPRRAQKKSEKKEYYFLVVVLLRAAFWAYCYGYLVWRCAWQAYKASRAPQRQGSASDSSSAGADAKAKARWGSARWCWWPGRLPLLAAAALWEHCTV